jgi:hypothetical protein
VHNHCDKLLFYILKIVLLLIAPNSPPVAMHSKENQDWKVDSRAAADCTRIKAIATLA